MSLSFPNKKVLSIRSVISILYKLDKNKVPNLIKEIELDYKSIIANIFRSASTDICAQFFAKDMHSVMRA